MQRAVAGSVWNKHLAAPFWGHVEMLRRHHGKMQCSLDCIRLRPLPSSASYGPCLSLPSSLARSSVASLAFIPEPMDVSVRRSCAARISFSFSGSSNLPVATCSNGVYWFSSWWEGYLSSLEGDFEVSGEFWLLSCYPAIADDSEMLQEILECA